MNEVSDGYHREKANKNRFIIKKYVFKAYAAIIRFNINVINKNPCFMCISILSMLNFV